MADFDRLLLTGLTTNEVTDHLARDSRLIVPIGACDQYGPHLPIGASTLVAEAFARNLSGECGVLRAPAMPFGVNLPSEQLRAGASSLRGKTLHGLLNDLLASWEDDGFTEFILLTVHDYDSHVEAIATTTGTGARVRVIETLNLDLSGFLDRKHPIEHGGEALTSLMLYLYPERVRMDEARDYFPGGKAISTLRRLNVLPAESPGSIGWPTLATREKGEALFAHICGRIRTRVFDQDESFHL
ncbi:MAG: creatininase family protein [Gemmatimonadota bacterium]|jgi:creatinine amidohydrolase|nr:creatininase family protein [Gemmatimonadota bacterium]